MTAFPRNRYDASEFIRGFDSAPLGDDGGELCISFPISNPENDEMLIYFPGCTDELPPDLLQLARQTCMRITQLDNLVQDSCEDEWHRCGLDLDAYDLHLAYIQIEAELVSLEYYGTKVNTQWTAKFRPSTSESWTKANF